MFTARLALALLALSSAPALASADPRADDTALLFNVMCLQHQDGGAYATKAFDSDPQAAQRLQPDELLKVVGPQLGTGFGWVMATPSGGEAVLAIAPAVNACSVVVRAADADSMREAFTATVDAFTAPIVAKGGKLLTSPATESVVDNIAVTQFGWDITADTGAQWVITGLIAAKPNADRQHLLTFARVK